MSEFPCNVRSDTMNSVISDDSAPRRERTRQYDMSESKSDKFAEEETFDSGILSEPNLSEAIFSETDLEPSTSTEDDRLGAVAQLPRIIEEKLSSQNADLDMGLNTTDSGIDIDVSDRINSLSIDSCSSLKSTTLDRQSTSLGKTENGPSRPIWEVIFHQDEDGDTTLHTAILEKNLKLVKKILQIVPNSSYLDIANHRRQTSLHLSVLTDQSHITRLLFLAGAKLDLEDMNGNTALHLACAKNYVRCVKALLNPITPYEQNYLTFDHKPVIDRPSEYLNEYNYDGLSCVHIAAKHADLLVLTDLLMCGADVNIRECLGGYTVLHEAAEWGDYRLVDFILQHSGIDVNKKNYARLTAYQLASRHPRIRQLLLDNGAECSISSNDEISDDSDIDDYSDSDTD